MAIITLSREYGSGGDEVADRLCETLGYHCFGKAQIIGAASETTLSKNNIIDYTEDNHEAQYFQNRLFGRAASPVQKIAWSENPSIAASPERADVHDTAVLSLADKAIRAAVGAGNMIIIGRGGQVILKDVPGVLHVRIEAPVEKRAEWVKQELKKEPGAPQSEKKLAADASAIIANRDMSSADYIKRYFNTDWNDRQLYHLVLNLGKFTVEQAVQIILTAVRAMESQPTSR